MTRSSARFLVPYALALGGAVAVTVAIGAATRVAPATGLESLYLLLVLWLGARWGRGPAIAGSLAAFLLYDFYFVPPVGTFAVRGPAEVLELFVLLAVALVTSELAASLRKAHAASDALAAESRSLYELATAALRTSDVMPALAQVCDRARALGAVDRFSLVAFDAGEPVLLAGDQLGPDELNQAAWSHSHGKPVGIAIKDGRLEVMRTAGTTSAYLPLTGGAVVVVLRPEHEHSEELRLLAALIGLADLLVDRRRATIEAERVRGLEASDKLKAAVLSSLSHELKSPIATLRAGLTALLAPRARLVAEQRELVGDMDRQSARLDRMVGDMLALSRLEAGVELDRQPQSFAELAASALQQVRGEARDREIVTRIAEDLPAVEVDELQAERLLTNLLENALNWTPPHGRIELGARLFEGRLEAWVENDGPEIPAADLDRIFDTFWTRRERGTGLGLAICKRVVEAHGGAIRAENRRRGPRFVFTLPLATVSAAT